MFPPLNPAEQDVAAACRRAEVREPIAFVGGGNMATALIGGLREDGWGGGEIHVVEPLQAQRDRLSQRFGICAVPSAGEWLRKASVVVWAVKPQVMREAAEHAAPFVREALHVSIAAGVRMGDLARWVGTDRVVRAMPNLPALVRAGVTGACAMPSTTASDRALATQILEGVGKVFWVDAECRMDAVTAVTGSGPGYVFHFLEGFQKAAEQMGFPSEEARELALLVVQGTSQLARQDGAEFRTLRERVSSKGGTTVAGTDVLDLAQTQEALSSAMKAACARASELGEQ